MPDEPLLMIPGPTPLSEAVRSALAEPVRSHTSAENAATMGAVRDGLAALVGSATARVHVFAGSGTLAMEAALVNHARPGDRVVVCSHGYFGDRFAEIATAHGMEPVVVSAPWGSHVDPAAVRAACAAARPAVVTVTHVDTSTGVLADAAALAEAARDGGAVLVLDGVCATGAVEEAMDAWGYDVVLTGAQKALAVPPGLAILAVSRRARERRSSLGAVPAYYADLARWDPGIDGPAYFSTHAVSLLRALEVSLEEVLAEGLQGRFARHREVAASLRAGLGALGMTPLTGAAVLAPTLSVMASPPGVDDSALRSGMAERGVVVAGCLGPFAGRGVRVGHMGTVRMTEVERTIVAAAGALAVDPAAALQAAGAVTAG